MSIEAVLARISELQALPLAAAPPVSVPDQGQSFSAYLAQVQAGASATAAASPGVSPGAPAAIFSQIAPPQIATTAPAQGAGTVGSRLLQAAIPEVGQREETNNDGAAIAKYRSSTRGAYPGAPWCAYFVSWAAQQAGAPLGEEGQGYGSVREIRAWAQRTGRVVPAGEKPRPGDLILFGNEHMGIVESVDPATGVIRTIEGNASNMVRRVERQPGEATDFVRVG